MNDIELFPVIELLRKKRPLFHSEADFQFALAWEIKCLYPTAEIRLEYPPENETNKYIVIFVCNEGYAYPIELKYKTKKLSAIYNDEQFHLKNHGAQDLGSYDFIKDICRVESFANHIKHFKRGYVLWLTNDQYYWNTPVNSNAGYAEFSVHHGAKKTGILSWGMNLSDGTIKGRESKLQLQGEHEILWADYSKLDVKDGVFKYALLQVDAGNRLTL